MGGKGIEVSDELVEHLEWLARIRLSGEERERLKRDLALLLDYFSQVVEAGVEGEEELLYPNPGGRLREDRPEPQGDPREHLGNALVEGGFVKAPRVVKD